METLEVPLAWDGILSFNLRNTAIIVWVVVMAFVVGKSMKQARLEAETAA